MARSIVVAACLVLALVVALLALRGSRPAPVPASALTIAVVPFSGAGSAGEDYLGIALADELAVFLSRSSQLGVRPFSQSRVYSGSENAARAARELRVELLVTGDYRISDSDLEIGLEIIDVQNNTVAWRDRLRVPRHNPLSWNHALLNWVNSTLFPALGLDPESGPSLPSDARAYELYLRSLELSEDPGPAHQRAIQMLDRSLAMDPGYAPAWDALARRLYLDSQTSSAGDSVFRRAEVAQQRALDLDPNLITAATGLTNMRVERGDLVAAHRTAAATVERLPNSALAHFSLSYVLRYMGRFEASLRECEVAYALDPQLRLRSCAVPYAMTGNFHRAHDFLDLAGDSLWVENKRAALFLRQGETNRALQIWKALPADYSGAGLWVACLEGARAPALRALAAQAEAATMTIFDPEPRYWDGALHAFCGLSESALRLLEAAIDHNYCAYPALDTDRLWDAVRTQPEFLRIREKGIACSRRFAGLP